MINVFIQARTSSERYPGKVLAPFRGLPLIDHVIAAVRRGLPGYRIVLLTSNHPTDTPLAMYVASQGIAVFRGSLSNVFQRFRDALDQFPCDAFFRVCADSPLIDPAVFERVLATFTNEDWDLVTTTYPRSYPKGYNTELVRTQRFLGIALTTLTDEEQEHLTTYYYNHPHQFRIKNVESGNPKLAKISLTVDTLADLKRLEKLSDQEIKRLCLD